MTQCTNCGNLGHIARTCLEPVTSYGVIAVRYSNPDLTNNQRLCSQKILMTGMEYSSDYEFLLIQRRDSLSFIEFIRGKYSTTDTAYLQKLFRAMTKDEQNRLMTKSFDELWKSVWGDTSNSHRTDYEHSERKMKQFNGEDGKGIERFISENLSVWDEPEWGFPKGRRNPHEMDVHCAIREFQEETNIERDKFHLIHNIQPLTETFFGSNQVHYCHKYYLAVCDTRFDVSMNYANPHMNREIGNIQWLPLDAALSKIRPDSVEKREILLKVGRILRNFCPVPIYDSKKS
jgi:8-oxo-dGTP pyrophosphatase MutT (NUDIX family)